MSNNYPFYLTLAILIVAMSSKAFYFGIGSFGLMYLVSSSLPMSILVSIIIKSYILIGIPIELMIKKNIGDK